MKKETNEKEKERKKRQKKERKRKKELLFKGYTGNIIFSFFLIGITINFLTIGI